MKKYLIIIMLCSFFSYAENNTLVIKLNPVEGIKVIQENNINPEPIVNPVCNNSEFGQCAEGQSQYTSAIGADIVTWNCTTNNLSVSCSKNAEAGINGVCGSSNNTTLSSIPTQNLCDIGDASFVTETSTNYNWSCSGNEGNQTTSNGNTIDCSALKPISALNTPYVVTQSANAQYGTAGSYSKFTSECAPYYSSGFCQHYTSRYVGSFIGQSTNPTFYMTYSDVVSIKSFEFSGFAYNHSSYQTKINVKYKDQNGQWQTAIDLMQNGHPKSLKIMTYTLPNAIVSKEFAIEMVITGGYFNLGYFKVLE